MVPMLMATCGDILKVHKPGSWDVETIGESDTKNEADVEANAFRP